MGQVFKIMANTSIRQGLILLLIIPTMAWSFIGTITQQKHDPLSITRDKEKIVGIKGVGVEMNDALRTGQGTAEITFEDNTIVQMTESSRLTIDDFVYEPKNKDAGKLAIRIAAGTARYASGQIAKDKPQAVKIKTPTATITVRGTDFTATVDEIGATTVILLPSCPFGWASISADCKTGAIDVESMGGIVHMDVAFQATRVPNLDSKPTPPIIVDLTEEMISNILILGPPKEIEQEEVGKTNVSVLDNNDLDQELLENELDKEEAKLFTDRLTDNLLDRNFLQNILDALNLQLKISQERTLAVSTGSDLLPDFVPDQGVTAIVDVISVELCMDTTGSDISCINVPTTQETTIRQIQGVIDITNRVNSEGTTIITTRQN